MRSSVVKSIPSATAQSPKPANIFYIWYAELCRRVNMQPLPNIKPAKPKNETVLDFAADRIKPEEWAAIINALRLDTSLHVIAIRSRVQCKFLFDIDTEDKAKNMKRRAGSLFTTYILSGLTKALSSSIRKSSVITSLELDGLPLFVEYLYALIEALKKNKTIRFLSFKYCPMRDLGCQELCTALRQMPNIEVLNLTACSLGALSAQYIARVVKYQQINRYCESWHSSLRYEDPEVGIMAGLKRITLNNNPYIGDQGLTYILDELDDDLWIKAIDMQRCGVTEHVKSRLLDVVEYSRSLEIADFRNNEQLSSKTVEKLFEILKNKQKFGYDCEYQWCVTAATLNDTSIRESATTVSKILPKSKSLPLKSMHSISTTNSQMNPLRRMKTCTIITKKQSEKSRFATRTMHDAKKDVLALNEELQKEVMKRIQSETENKKLKEELEKIKSTIQLNEIQQPKEKKIIKFDEDNKHRCHKPKNIKYSNAEHKNKVEFIFENRAPTTELFQKFINKNAQDSDSEDDFSCYFNESVSVKKNNNNNNNTVDNGSNSSLIKFMQDMKKDITDKENRRNQIWNNNSNGFRNVNVSIAH